MSTKADQCERPVSLWGHDTIAPKRLTMADIIQRVAEKHRVTVAQILSDSRCQRITQPRQEAMWHCVNEDRWSLPQIGRAFGRDHTTVLHGKRAHEKRMGAL